MWGGNSLRFSNQDRVADERHHVSCGHCCVGYQWIVSFSGSGRCLPAVWPRVPIRSPGSVFSISPRGTMPGRAGQCLRELRAVSGSPCLFRADGPHRRSARHEEVKARRRGDRGGMRRLWRNGISSREGDIPWTADLSRALQGVRRQRPAEQIIADLSYGCSLASSDIGTFV